MHTVRIIRIRPEALEAINYHMKNMFDGFKRLDINRKREERNKVLKRAMKGFSRVKIKPLRVRHNL